MTGDPVGIKFFVFVVVVPIDQFHFFGDVLDDFFRDDTFPVVVVIRFAAAAEVHVGPHHGLEAVFFAQFHHFFQVAVDDVERGFLAVQVFELAGTDAVGFIHTQVDPAAADGFLPGDEHFFDKLVSLRLIHQQDAVDVPHAVVVRPAEHLLQVPEGLDAGDHFDAEACCIFVDFLDFIRGVCAAHGAEERFAFDLVSLFCVKHYHVVAENGETVQIGLHVIDSHHGIPGAVDHDAEHFKGAVIGFFGDGSGEDRAHHTERHIWLVVSDRDRVFCLFDAAFGGLSALLEFQLDPAFFVRQRRIPAGEDFQRGCQFFRRCFCAPAEHCGGGVFLLFCHDHLAFQWLFLISKRRSVSI